MGVLEAIWRPTTVHHGYVTIELITHNKEQPMTAVIDRLGTRTPEKPAPAASGQRPRWLINPIWNRFTPLQLLVITVATVAPLVAAGAITAGLLGLISQETMMNLALGAGENPGMITFGAMFLASPVQEFTGRTQVRVRKYLGIVFFLLALNNGAMFVLESGLAAALGAPLLIAGSIALVVAVPLFLTSSRWSQRTMGMKRWRLLHKATYVIAAALMAHVLLVPDIGPGFVLITLGFILRIPAAQRWLASKRRGEQP